MLLEAQKYFRSKESQTKVIKQKDTQTLHLVYFPTRHTTLDCVDNMHLLFSVNALLQQNFGVWITSTQAKIRL
jgi:hypothetical protein